MAVLAPPPLVARGPRRRLVAPALISAALAAAMAGAWPLLATIPALGGPLAALAAGLAAWTGARAIAPRAHANDNAPRPLSPARAIRDRPSAQRAEARAMLGGKDKAESRRAGGLSVIGADVTVTGNIDTPGDLHIDGTVEGDIRCGSLVQGASGRIVGSVVATSARLAGAIEGRVSATSLVIEKAARLRGDADYRSLQIENGAQVDGRMAHLAEGRAGSDSPLRLVDASDAAG